MKPIYILNAPAGCGKDTIANQVVEECGARVASFKYPLYNIFTSTTGMPNSEFFHKYEDRSWKEGSQEFLNGHTPREFMIHISEKFIKPFFGDDYFGKWVADYITFHEQDRESEMVWVIPDGGFQVEVEALLKVFGDRVKVLQITREGFNSFYGDSRGWVSTSKGVEKFDTTNGNEVVVNYIKKEVLNVG